MVLNSPFTKTLYIDFPPLRAHSLPFRTNTQNDVLFIIEDWNAKVGSQETPGITGKFGLGIRNEAGQRLIMHWS